jgi:hypothetical protein
VPQYGSADERDARRRLLIEAGQLEQALADRLGNDPLVQRVMTVTDLAADAFLGYADLGPIQKALAEIELPPDLTVRVKVPEGFAFYALYPEQYAEAARRWIRDHADSGSKRAAAYDSAHGASVCPAHGNFERGRSGSGFRTSGGRRSGTVRFVNGSCGTSARRSRYRPTQNLLFSGTWQRTRTRRK